MGQDTLVYAEQVVLTGKLSTDNGNFKTDGVSGNVTVSGTTTAIGNVVASGTLGVTGALTASSVINANAGISTTTLSGGLAATSSLAVSAGAIVTAGVRVQHLTTAGGAVATSTILNTGTLPGQMITIINENTTAASSITFDVSGTSHVANGATSVVSGLNCATFFWDPQTTLWYHSI